MIPGTKTPRKALFDFTLDNDYPGFKQNIPTLLHHGFSARHVVGGSVVNLPSLEV